MPDGARGAPCAPDRRARTKASHEAPSPPAARNRVEPCRDVLSSLWTRGTFLRRSPRPPRPPRPPRLDPLGFGVDAGRGCRSLHPKPLAGLAALAISEKGQNPIADLAISGST